MKVIVANRKNKILPWGVEIELMDGRCIYLSAEAVNTLSDRVDVVIDVTSGNKISVPKAGIRKILIMGTDNDDRQET
ncbi:MAG: hypothetical protein ACXABY_10280 [Candidatus Thorarchaeota archaeon]|jgi:hypothetical protein